MLAELNPKEKKTTITTQIVFIWENQELKLGLELTTQFQGQSRRAHELYCHCNQT